MASEDMGLVQAQQRLNNGLNHPQHVFQDTFSCGPPPQRRPAITSVADPGVPKATTRELTGEFMDHHRHHHYFHQPTPADFRGSMFSSAAATSDPPHRDNSHTWNASRASTTPSGDGSEDDDVEDDDDNDDNDNDDENEVEGLVAIDDNDNNNNNNNSNNNNNNTVNCNDKINSTNNSSDKLGNQKSKHLSSFGMKEGNAVGQCGNDSNNSEMRNAVTVSDVDGEMYYSQYLQGTTEVLPNSGQKDTMVVENVCGFSGRKDGVYSSESGESLRTILSDPSTGALMDDAMILPCGHSFGSGGMQHVLRMKACCTCSQAVSEDSVSPNLSLRAAVLAFRREKELQVNRASKRRRERYEQDKGTYGDSGLTYHPRGRGVQFPFVVTDRVIIKGNKRTPPRFVGREAIVTMQCLNGWYVVKTLDNAESVKLQYRSLAKVPDNQCLKPISSKITPDWL